MVVDFPRLLGGTKIGTLRGTNSESLNRQEYDPRMCVHSVGPCDLADSLGPVTSGRVRLQACAHSDEGDV